MKSERWLKMTDEERLAARQRAIAMLEQMYHDPRFNPAAKEATYLMAQRMEYQNERLACKIAREAMVRCRIIPTRPCPTPPCGDGPCARLESDDERPWMREASR